MKKLINKLEDHYYESNYLHQKAELLLQAAAFDYFIGLIIVSNSVTMGLQHNLELAGTDTTYINLLENLFLCVYVFELLLRFYVYGWRSCLHDGWVRFDLLIVIIGVI